YQATRPAGRRQPDAARGGEVELVPPLEDAEGGAAGASESFAGPAAGDALPGARVIDPDAGVGERRPGIEAQRPRPLIPIEGELELTEGAGRSFREAIHLEDPQERPGRRARKSRLGDEPDARARQQIAIGGARVAEQLDGPGKVEACAIGPPGVEHHDVTRLDLAAQCRGEGLPVL